MSNNAPDANLVSGKWNKETKRFDKEYGAAWVKQWDDGSISLSFKIKETVPEGEFVKLNISKFGKVELTLKTGLDDTQQQAVNKSASQDFGDEFDSIPF